jgi:large subunit ribosomal protein L29
METEKIRDLTAEELVQHEKDSMDQLFRLKFQMKMGQTESLNKIRGLRKDIARMKTIARQRELGGAASSEPKAAVKTAAKAAARPAGKAVKKAATKPAKKTARKTEKK